MQGIGIMLAIINSDVIIIDRNRYAVAIRYDENTDKVPMIVARGMDADAVHIQQFARKNAIHSVENPPLARSLCGTCLPIFLVPLPPKQIPEEHYVAVAEILAYVYPLTKEPTS